jgi:hypothetical protein
VRRGAHQLLFCLLASLDAMNHKARVILLTAAVGMFCLPAVTTKHVVGQTRGPVATTKPRAESAASEAAPVKPARWPFKLGLGLFDRNKQDKESGGDPFIRQGADEQQQLAAELTAAGGIQTGAYATSQPKSPTYPWPNPVDNRSAPANPAGGTTWQGGDAANQAAAPGSRIVEAIRQANAQVKQRIQTTAQGPAS